MLAEAPARPIRGMGAAMAGGNAGGISAEPRSRSERDFYATPAEVTRALVRRFHPNLHGVGWECCGGNGAMAAELLKAPQSPKLLVTDIAPRPASEWAEGITVKPLDLFAVKALPNDAKGEPQRRFDFIITNPPFDIAADIIEHIFGVAEPKVNFVALLLKSTFWHAKKRQKLFYRRMPTTVLPLTWRPDFMNLGAPTMEVAWNVWIRGNASGCFYEPLDRPEGETSNA
jgi:Methyltransferase small domain